MTVTIWDTNEVFTARIYKRLTGRPDLLWANTYELNATDTVPLGADQAREVLLALALWESKFHLTDVTFDRGVFSTYVPDGAEYAPESFVVRGFTGVVGTRAVVGGQPLGLDQTFFARRNVSFGRTGRALYRRVLAEQDVTAESGTTRLVPGSVTELQALLDGNLPEPLAGFDIFEALGDLSMQMVMVLRDGVGSGEKRVINGFDAVGVTTKKTNNAFFNRRTPPLP